MKIFPNTENIGIIGPTGKGKSYMWEHKLFPGIEKSMLIWDLKNQYGNLTKRTKFKDPDSGEIREQDWEIFTIIEKDNPAKEFRRIYNKIKKDYVFFSKLGKKKYKFIIRLVPKKPKDEVSFNQIMKLWTETKNTITILEEAHLYRRNKTYAFTEFEYTMRLRTGIHNLNSNVIWISQGASDVPREIYDQTQVLFVFKFKENRMKDLYQKRIIPELWEDWIQVAEHPITKEPLYKPKVIRQ